MLMISHDTQFPYPVLEYSRLASKRGPTSASWTSLCDVLAKTWCLDQVSPDVLLLIIDDKMDRNDRSAGHAH